MDRVGWLSPPAPYKYYKIEDEWGEAKGGEKQRRTIEREGDKGMKNKERPFKEREILREEVTNKLKKRGGTFERIREDERKKNRKKERITKRKEREKKRKQRKNNQ